MLVLYLQMLDEPQQKASFEQFYRKYRQAMFAVAFGILHNKQDAEDAVSQAFFSIAKSFEKISHLDSHEMKAYAVIVCRNKSLNIYKQNKRRTEQRRHHAVLLLRVFRTAGRRSAGYPHRHGEAQGDACKAAFETGTGERRKQ